MHLRKAYYTQLGFENKVLEEGESTKRLENILKASEIDLNKLRFFCSRRNEGLPLPSRYRSLVWNLLLGFLPAQQSAWKFVHEQRAAHYSDLERLAIFSGLLDASFISCFSPPSSPLSTSPLESVSPSSTSPTSPSFFTFLPRSLHTNS